MRRTLALLILPLVGSCGGSSPVDPSDPTGIAPSLKVPFRVLRSVEFSEGLELDLYLPDDDSRLRPAVVYVHGGEWSTADRTQFFSQATHMAESGFVGAVIEHRLPPAHPFPAALHDVKASVRWLRANADTFRIDPTRIGVVGASSGAYLAALVGTTDGVHGFLGDNNLGYSSAVQGVVAFSPILDLPALGQEEVGTMARAFQRFLGRSYSEDAGLWTKASPHFYVNQRSAPFLLLHGTADLEVPHNQSQEMRDALAAAGVHVELFLAEGADHRFFERPWWKRPTLRVMEDFFVQVLR